MDVGSVEKIPVPFEKIVKTSVFGTDALYNGSGYQCIWTSEVVTLQHTTITTRNPAQSAPHRLRRMLSCVWFHPAIPEKIFFYVIRDRLRDSSESSKHAVSTMSSGHAPAATVQHLVSTPVRERKRTTEGDRVIRNEMHSSELSRSGHVTVGHVQSHAKSNQPTRAHDESRVVSSRSAQGHSSQVDAVLGRFAHLLCCFVVKAKCSTRSR